MSGDTRNVPSVGLRRGSVNRNDPRDGRGPFAGAVKGMATQVTPNGTAYGGGPEPTVPAPVDVVGAMPEWTPWSNGNWPNGNRSGE